MRETRGWSQQQLADNSGVPRPTIANLESGDGNPTLSVMLRIAQALGASMEQLVSDRHQRFELYEEASLPSRAMGEGAARQLYFEVAGTELLRLELPARGRAFVSQAHSGFLRIISCESGKVEVKGQSERARLKSGDLLRWRSGEGVEVLNLGARTSSLLLVTLPQYPGG
jgi:transcriptional regulator with XRE-family HTH domain